MIHEWARARNIDSINLLAGFDCYPNALPRRVLQHNQDVSGQKYLEFHQKLLGGRGQADRAHALAVAKEIGLDMPRVEKDMASAEVKATLDESRKLAQSLNLSGTPSYVIGSDVLVGAVGIDTLREKINVARK